MVSLPRVIDIEDKPDFLRIVEAVRESNEPIVIRQHGEEVAVLSPAEPHGRRPARPVTEADIEAFRAAAGAWKDIDTDKLLEDIYADRDISDRPPVDL